MRKVTARVGKLWGSTIGARRLAVLAVGILPLGAAAIAAGQASTGSITGKVEDASKGLIPGATVTLRNVDTNETFVVKTSGSGLYTLSSVPPGSYTVSVSKKGFADTQVTAVSVNIASTTTVDVSLQVGNENASVTVVAQDQLLDKSSPTISIDVPTEISESIPLPERSALEVVMLSPGVQGDPDQNLGVPSENPGIFTGPVVPGGGIAVGGGRPGSALQLVDGVDLSGVGYPRVAITFSGDDLKQITVQSAGIAARYGRSGGGVINQASKGGELVYHGKISYRHIDPFFEATSYGQGMINFGSVSVPVTQSAHQNLFTFLVSGPVPISYRHINKNTFFFASYEPLRAGNKNFGRTRVPTPAELSGDFSNSFTALDATILSKQGYAAAVAAPRIGCPNTAGPAVTGCYGLFYRFALNANGFPTGAQIPTNSKTMNPATPVPNANLSAQLAQNPLAKFVLSQFPTPSVPSPYISFFNPDGSYANDGNNAIAARGVQNIDNRYNIRVDQNLGDADHAFGRFTSVPVSGNRYYFNGPDSPIDNQPESSIHSNTSLLDYTHIIHGNAVNDLRFSYTRLNYAVNPAPSSLTTDFAAKYGLTPSEKGAGFPSLSIDTGSYGSSTGGNDGGLSLNEVYSVGDDFSFVKGNHSISLGGEWRAMQLNRLPNTGIYGGTYGFNQGDTGNGSTGGNRTASFILGSVSSLQLSTVQEFYYRFKYVGLYAMDLWKVSPRLTLNVGLRYNLEFPRTEKYGLQGSFAPGVTGSLNNIAATGAFAFSGQNGLPTTLYPVSYKGLEPRLGFALAVTPSFVVRGSFGLIHAPMTGVTNSAVPALTPGSLTIGNLTGGTDPTAWVNYITNPVLLPSSGIPPILHGPNPVFSYANSANLPPNLPWVSQSSSVPYTENWSLSFQSQLTKSTLIQGAYVGNSSHHLFSSPTDTNILPLNTITSEVQSNFAFSSLTTASIYGTAVPKGNANINSLPYPQFANNTIAASYVRESSANYNALYLNGLQRAYGGLTLIASFTWSKSLDDGSAGTVDGTSSGGIAFAYPQTPFSKQGEYSYSTYDIPTHLTGALSWQVPVGKRQKLDFKNSFLNELLGGFRTSTIFNTQSGTPALVTLGSVGYFYSNSTTVDKVTGKITTVHGGNGNGILNGAGHYNLRPNLNPGVPLLKKNWRLDPFNLTGSGGYIDPAAFSVPGTEGDPQLGNAPRALGNARGPAIITFDANVNKSFSMHSGRVHVQLQADAINVLNHANYFVNPNATHNYTTSLDSTKGIYNTNPIFGTLQETTPGRTFALGASITY